MKLKPTQGSVTARLLARECRSPTVSAIMPQHEECNLFLEDFEKSERSLPCELCKLLDGRTCLGVSHKRKDTGKIIIPAHACQFYTAALKLFLFIS